MKKYRKISLMCLLAVLLCGCGNVFENKKLPDSPIIFTESVYTNPDNTKEECISIIYNGREYVPYGVAYGQIAVGEPKECVGYIKREDYPNDTSFRIYTLSATDDFIVEYGVGALMEYPIFLRALDTQGKEIEIPSYIEKLDNDFWK